MIKTLPEDETIDGLNRRLQSMGRAAVAVSGGVDSMTLSVVAHRALGSGAQLFHAVSPAVPAEATSRVRDLAAKEGWALEIFDAGEFEDANYRTNPVDRCFFCKGHLYGAIGRKTDATIVSGTNLDDLGDYRPGLQAALEHSVRHPFVESKIDKRGVRRIARALGLDLLADLPAAPCLSSRIETGIAIEPDVLASVYAVETLVRHTLSPQTVRCRFRAGAVVVELDRATLERLSGEQRRTLSDLVSETFGHSGVNRVVEFEPYRMGSAFLR